MAIYKNNKEEEEAKKKAIEKSRKNNPADPHYYMNYQPQAYINPQDSYSVSGGNGGGGYVPYPPGIAGAYGYGPSSAVSPVSVSPNTQMKVMTFTTSPDSVHHFIEEIRKVENFHWKLYKVQIIQAYNHMGYDFEVTFVWTP